MGEFVGTGLESSGLTLNPLIVQRSIRRALFAPQCPLLEPEVRRIIDADFGALTNSLNDDGVGVSLPVFAMGNVATAGGVGSDPLGLTNTEWQDLSDLDVMVVGDQAYVVGDVTSILQWLPMSQNGFRVTGETWRMRSRIYISPDSIDTEMGGIQSQPYESRCRYILN